MKNKIEIDAKPSHSNNVCFFTLSIPLLKGSKAECFTKQEAKNAPLFDALLDFSWVLDVAAEGNTLVIRKRNPNGWQDDARKVAELIRGLYEEGTPFFNEAYLANVMVEKDQTLSDTNLPFKANDINVKSPLGLRIQKILTDVIGPSLASHGGHVNLVDVKDGKVSLYFGGGCQGCSQASVTVKQGIEKLLLKEFPELTEVDDVTNHAVGTNPYFK